MALGTSSIDPLPPLNVIFGKSQSMRAIREQLERISAANLPVLIHGESGTGKDVLARLFHKLSPWATGPFVKINCPAIPASLMESELFGYERGAFTGANTSKPGRVEMAHRGTLFLDEISELDLGLQSKLLQLLQDGQFCRIGAHEDKKVEVRVICATNRKLEEEIEAGHFRSDLFYRINVLNVHVAPLRERPEDIPILVDYFIEIYNDKYNMRARPLSPQVMRKLQNYTWPGNIRELENIIKRYIIFGMESVFAELPERQASVVNPSGGFLIPAEVAEGSAVSLKKLTKQLVVELEKQIIFKSLQAHDWNRKKTAQALRISYRALLYKIRDAGLSSPRAASSASPIPAESTEIEEEGEARAVVGMHD
jgi:two-component system, NtrC family, response regulator AtoC